MASTNVRFFFGTLAKYQALASKDPMALYFVTNEETGKVYLYKGDQLFASDSLASTIADGWMSKEDKINLDNLVANAVTNLTPVDGSIVITDGNKIGVALSAEAGNILSLKGDGLYVDTTGVSADDVPSYEIEKQADSGDAVAVYKLKKTVGTESSYVGDAITIPKDLVISSGSLEIVAEADVPYAGAVVGEPYLDIVLSNADSEHIYIPVKGLVDTYTAGDGLQLIDGTFSINLGTNANGLHFVDGSLNLALASADSAGAMSAEMFTAVDGLLKLDIATKSDLQEVIAETVGTPNAEQFTIDENGVLNITSLDADKVMYNGQKLSDVLDEMNNTYVWEELTETVDTTADSAVASISAASEGATVKIASGTVAEAVTLDKSVTVEGETAGVAQNFSQEV